VTLVIQKPTLESLAKTRFKRAKESRKKRLKKEFKPRGALDLEFDNERKIGRIMAVTQCTSKQAEKLADYDPKVYDELPKEKHHGAEKIQGKTIDFVDISFLELARIAGNSVGRITFHNSQPQGTGFMISDELFLTNNHVISGPHHAKNFRVQFDYELDVNDSILPVTSFALDPDKFFLTDPTENLDFTIIAIGERIQGEKTLADFGYSPLLDNGDKHVISEFVNIIQHPAGHFKQIVLRENQLEERFDDYLYYTADTLGGSSGSPVFNDQFEVIALHHWGGSSKPTGPGGKHETDINEGVRISSIVSKLKSKKKDFEGNQLRLLESILNYSSREKHGLRTSSQNHSKLKSSSSTNTVRFGETVKIQIPLEISVALGSHQKSTSPDTMLYSFTDGKNIFPEKVSIDLDYSNRPGYDPDFLPHWNVSLPLMTKKIKKNAAEKLEYGDDEDPYELKYQHFSLVMNANRQLAYFTAVNIDGDTWIKIIRETGEPQAESAEGAEKWFNDPRIAIKDQTEQSLYDDQIQKVRFDRGHSVMRLDPAWGNNAIAIRANADTFHFTNCYPQSRSFNSGGIWRKLENYIINNAKKEDRRVTVFTGAVFETKDPKFRNFKIPKQFWKIIIREENNTDLVAAAFLTDQSKFLEFLSDTPEKFDDTSKIDEYQTTITEIEKLTGLDFGSLKDFDALDDGDGAERIHRVKIERLDQIKLSRK